MYLLNVNSSMSLLDSLAYCGYKFVPLIGTLLLKLGAGKKIVYSFFLYSMIAYGFFTVLYAMLAMLHIKRANLNVSFKLRTLRYCILPDANSGNEIVGKPARKRRVIFLFAIAALQIITTWILL